MNGIDSLVYVDVLLSVRLVHFLSVTFVVYDIMILVTDIAEVLTNVSGD